MGRRRTIGKDGRGFQMAISYPKYALRYILGLAEKLHWYVYIPFFLEFNTFLRDRLLTVSLEESLTMLRGLGLQTSTSSSTYLQTPTTRFIPTTCIQDIFIHEAFKGFEVRFYLVIVVEGEDEVVVVFPNLLPRREVLEVVWRGVRRGLWEQGGPKPKAEVKENNEKVET